MFDELEKYKEQGNFFFESTDSLSEVCNAPADRYGIYVVYALKKGRVELIYIGKSGSEANDSLKQHLTEGLHFDEVERKNCWPVQMMIEDIETLHVHWYVTMDNNFHDPPGSMSAILLRKYQSIYGQKPRWNVAG